MKNSLVAKSSIIAITFFAFIQCTSAQFVNATYENASTLGKKNSDFAVHYTGYTFYFNGESGNVFQQFGVRFGLGLSEYVDLKLCYSRITLSDSYGGFGLNYLEISPKFSISRNRLAFYSPFGIIFGQGNDTKFWSPKLLFTFPSNNHVDASISTGAIIPLNSSSDNPIFNFNFGLGFSSNLLAWALRPEIGILFSSSSKEKGHYLCYGMGFNFHFK